MAVGSPGGASIIGYVVKALVGVLDWKLPMQEAIELPNLIAGGSFYAAEVDKFSPEVKAGLEAKGVKLTAGFGGSISCLLFASP